MASPKRIVRLIDKVLESPEMTLKEIEVLTSKVLAGTKLTELIVIRTVFDFLIELKKSEL